MRRPVLLLYAAATASLFSACLGQERQPAAVSNVATSSTSARSSDTDGSSRAASTTTAATTSSSSTTTSTTAPLVHYPSQPATPLPRGSIQVYSRIDTTDPVVFLTLDDGIVRDPRIIELLAQHDATATLFLNSGPLSLDPAYFRQFIDAGGTANSHTFQHPHLPELGQDDQRQQICGMAQQIEATYGSAGYFFRPPYGEFDDNTLIAARSCGLRALLLWRVSLNGGSFQTWGNRPIAAGDIVLGHFRDDLYDCLVTLFAELDRLGLRVARVEDYLPAA